MIQHGQHRIQSTPSADATALDDDSSTSSIKHYRAPSESGLIQWHIAFGQHKIQITPSADATALAYVSRKFRRLHL